MAVSELAKCSSVEKTCRELTVMTNGYVIPKQYMLITIGGFSPSNGGFSPSPSNSWNWSQKWLITVNSLHVFSTLLSFLWPISAVFLVWRRKAINCNQHVLLGDYITIWTVLSMEISIENWATWFLWPMHSQAYQTSLLNVFVSFLDLTLHNVQ